MCAVDLLILLGLALLLQAPFLNKAFHIDDTVVLEVSKRILDNPLDPLAGTLDWFGHVLPLWEVTTNPPLLSYYLAPILALWGLSEVLMHLVMVPFLFMLLASCLVLARRFGSHPWLTVMTVGGSSAVLVSMNVMRDAPAMALTAAGLTLCVVGADSEPRRRPLLTAGALLVGLAVLTKYSAGVGLIVLGLYFVWSGRERLLHWLLVACLPLLVWCSFTWLQYGEAHPVFLLLRKHSSTPRPATAKYFSMLVLLTSVCLVLPFLLARMRRHAGIWHIANIVFALAMVWASRRYYQADLDPQFALWTFLGSLSLGALALVALLPGGRLEIDPISLFLLVWTAGYLAFSVFIVPFQAVRHVLPALLPIVLLALRTEASHKEDSGSPRWAWGVVGCQLILTFLVGWADVQYANSYRDFARHVESRYQDEEIWYLGHWGWKVYTDAAGFRQLHRGGEDPPAGSLLVWPQRVHIGSAMRDRTQFRESLELVESREIHTWLPIRTMLSGGASFYAVGRQQVPFAFSNSPLEIMRVYRVP